MINYNYMNTTITYNISNYYDIYNKYLLIRLLIKNNDKIIPIQTHVKIHYLKDVKYIPYLDWLDFYILQLYGITIGQYNRFIYSGDGHYKNDFLYIYFDPLDVNIARYYVVANNETIEVDNNFIFQLIDKFKEILEEIKKTEFN